MNKLVTLCLLFAMACGGSPTSSDPIVTIVGDGTEDAGPDTAVIGTPNPTPDPPAPDAGETSSDTATDTGTPIPPEDAGKVVLGEDSGTVTQDAGPETVDAGPHPVTNDAGMPLCCTNLPTLNSLGYPNGTLPPQSCGIWGMPDGGYPVGVVVCGIAVDPTDFVCALRQDGQTTANQGTLTVCP